MVTPRQLEWAAGFLEGEGSFTVDSGVRVSAQQVQREPLERLKAMFGGRIRRITGRNCNGWQVSGMTAAGIMMTMYGLMSPRRKKQIAGSLFVWRSKPLPNNLKVACPRGHAYSGHNLLRVHGRRRCRSCHNAGVN